MNEFCPRCGGGVELAYEYRGIYDGALVFACDQGHQWPRFPIGTRLGDLALKQIQEDADV